MIISLQTYDFIAKSDMGFMMLIIQEDVTLLTIWSEVQKLWLKLPPSVRQIDEKGEFKSGTKKYFGV